ncbi:MAG TPA: aminoglycoside phosphotransferase family protein [Gemmatimonadales bacterium]|jgi:aminoglycoside phosphotransferase (APT) family kinase protein|nr:aminoglycoside phosphotransferase family protein [Gemmatimonadales bacterium]
MSDPREALAQFALEGDPDSIEPFPGGHINETYRVAVRRGGARLPYLLQRVNPRVFPDPVRVMENVAHVTEHVARRLSAAGIADWRRRVIVLAPARDGRLWVTDADGGIWRLYPFVHARVTERATTPGEAREAARAFGRFLALLADYPGPPLHETIAGFHDTARRYAALDGAVETDACRRVAAARAQIDALLAQRSLADVLPPLLARGEVPRRVVHNDAKISNVLFDTATGEALGVVDLDTVMPGSALHDFGDLVRSTASPTDEDEPDLRRVHVRLEFFEALVRGFLAEDGAGPVLVPRERELLVCAGRLITLEQAVRFLTDHLNGDAYYRVTRPGQNLDRCRTQLRLVESLTAAQEELEEIVRRA